MKKLIVAFTVLVLACHVQAKSPNVTLQTNFGDIEIELLDANAPITVANFLGYVRSGFYDGLIFHRVYPGFVIQGGGFDPNLVLKEPANPIVNEFGVSNTKGTLAMAKIGGDPNSATSQFFINMADNGANSGNPDNLDIQNGGFTVFARVIGGMDVVNEINEVNYATVQGMQNVPVGPNTPVMIYQATVTPEIDGDIDGDFDVDMADLGIMNVNWQAGVEQVPAIVADIGSESSDMSGDLYVWSDGPIGSSNIYAYDFAEANEYPITANPDERSNPATDGRTIVWQDKRAGNYDIYGYDIIDEREFVISDSNWHAVKPSVSGDIVVWRDYRNYHVVEGLGKLKTDIYGADISDPNNPVVFPISTAVNGETDPAVDGNIVVWNDYRHGENKIYAADISDINDPNEFMVSDSLGKQINPDISGNVIIWEVIIWEDYQYGNKVIMSYDIVRQTEKLIVFGEVSDSDIEGDLIVWLDKRNGNWDVYGYDLSAEKEFLISSFDANDANPITGGRIITWQDGDSADDGIYWRRKCDEYLAGDVDDNCIADVNDLVLLALNWLKSSL